MTANTKPSAQPFVSRLVARTPPLTIEERLQRIEALGQRVNGYVQYMCQAAQMNNTSAEARDKAVVAFYEQMVLLECHLGRIHDDLKLE